MALFDALKNINVGNLRKLGLFGKESESVLGIDIGSSAIKVVQLRRRHGSAVLETYGELALGPYMELAVGQVTSLPSDKIVSALTDLLKESSTSTNDCGVSIPFNSSLIAYVQVPDLPEKQLAKMIPLEARKYIPVPIGEVALDWFILPEVDRRFSDDEEEKKDKKEGNTPKREVLLVAIHNSVLENYKGIVSSAGLRNSFFEIEIFSTIRAAMDQTFAPTAVIDMGAASTKLYIVEYGIVKSSHLINRGGQDVTLAVSKSLGMEMAKAEVLKRESGLTGFTKEPLVAESLLLVLDQIFAEAARVILNYQKRSGRNVGRAILTGGGAMLKGVGELAEKHLEMSVSLADPFSRVEAPAFLENVLKDIGPEFSVAVGLAFRKLQEYE